MKGHRSLSTFQGYTTGPAVLSHYPDQDVTDFVVGVGGYRDRGIPGVFIHCHVWGENAKKAVKAIKYKGLAVIISGALTQSTRQVDGSAYINNDLKLWSLFAQRAKTHLTLSEIF